MLQMGFLKLLYGADMRENNVKYPCTFKDEPPYEVTSTPWLSSQEIIMLKNCEDALDRLYNEPLLRGRDIIVFSSLKGDGKDAVVDKILSYVR